VVDGSVELENVGPVIMLLLNGVTLRFGRDGFQQ
jgi:hypothetical protein